MVGRAPQKPVGRFGPLLHNESMGHLGTCPTPEPAKRPAFNTVNSAPESHFIGTGNQPLPLVNGSAKSDWIGHITEASSGYRPGFFRAESIYSVFAHTSPCYTALVQSQWK